MNKQKFDLTDPYYKDLFFLAAMTFVLFALKALWSISIASGPTVSDELLYKFNASAIFEWKRYATAHYPPAYSLTLVPALFFRHWYEAMLVCNAFWSSLVVPATWFLGRAAGLRYPLRAAVLASLLPMHAVYPNVLFSENLFVPLFVVALALAQRGGRSGNTEALTFGVVLGLAHLTKYLFLPALPLLFGSWVYFRSKSNLRVPTAGLLRRYYPALLVVLAYCIIIGIWICYGLTSGYSLRKLFGFGISGISAKAAITVHSLLMWIAAYTFYIILAWLPIWGIVTIWLSQLRDKAWRSQPALYHWRFLALVLLLVGGYWLLSVQHSFGASYNYPVPVRLIGRYLMHLSPIMLVVGLLLLESIAENPLSIGKTKALAGVGILASLASLAWWVLFNKGIWSFSVEFANREPGTVDTIALVYPAMFLFVIAMILLLLAMICFRKNKPRAWLLPIAALMLVSLVVDAARMYNKRNGLHHRELAAAAETMPGRQDDTLHVYYDGFALQLKYFKERMLFWGIKRPVVPEEAVSYKRGIHFPSLPSPSVLITNIHFDINALREYKIGNKRYRIYRIDDLDPRVLSPKILAYGHGSIKEGMIMSEKPAGAHSIWFKHVSASPVAFLSLDGLPLKTIFGKDGQGSALIPRQFIGKPRNVELRLCDPFTNTESEPVDFQIFPPEGNNSAF